MPVYSIDNMLKNAQYSRESYSDDAKDALWCGRFVEKLSNSFPDDLELKEWAEEKTGACLSNIEIVNNDAFEVIVKEIRKQGFMKCQNA